MIPVPRLNVAFSVSCPFPNLKSSVENSQKNSIPPCLRSRIISRVIYFRSGACKWAITWIAKIASNVVLLKGDHRASAIMTCPCQWSGIAFLQRVTALEEKSSAITSHPCPIIGMAVFPFPHPSSSTREPGGNSGRYWFAPLQRAPLRL